MLAAARIRSKVDASLLSFTERVSTSSNVTITSRLADGPRERLLFDRGAGGKGLEGGLPISIFERDRAFSEMTPSILALSFRTRRRASALILGAGELIRLGDWERGEGGGRFGLAGRSGRPGNGLFGGSAGLDTLFKDLRVSFFLKSTSSACLPVA